MMPCEERVRLQKEHTDAEAMFDDARQALGARIGLSPKEEYLTLNRAAEKAWAHLQHSLRTLDEHIRTHRC